MNKECIMHNEKLSMAFVLHKHGYTSGNSIMAKEIMQCFESALAEREVQVRAEITSRLLVEHEAKLVACRAEEREKAAGLVEVLKLYANPTEELRDRYGVGLPDFYVETAFDVPAIDALATYNDNRKG